MYLKTFSGEIKMNLKRLMIFMAAAICSVGLISGITMADATDATDGTTGTVPQDVPRTTQVQDPDQPTGTDHQGQKAVWLNYNKAVVVCRKKLPLLRAYTVPEGTPVKWTSSDTKVATVTSNGIVSGLKAGYAVITVTTPEGLSDSCTVTVLYKDVTQKDDFWYEPTYELTSKGIVKGYEDQTEFRPANNCTRAQMVTFIWRLAGCPAPSSKESKFSDVVSGKYYYKSVLWACEKGITTGYKDGTFKPNVTCLRRHAVTFLWRYAGSPAPTGTEIKFKDVKEDSYYAKPVIWASENKILEGYEDGTFKPEGECLRRQMVTFLYKYDKFITGGSEG